jgi:hypothetical protein
MDESTRTIIAYGTLLFGIPLLTAKILWFVPGAISASVFSHITHQLDRFINAIIEGFLALLLACLVFNHFHLPVVWKIPITLIIVTSLWHTASGAAWSAMSSILGIIAGYLLYPQVMLLFAKYFAATM